MCSHLFTCVHQASCTLKKKHRNKQKNSSLYRAPEILALASLAWLEYPGVCLRSAGWERMAKPSLSAKRELRLELTWLKILTAFGLNKKPFLRNLYSCLWVFRGIATLRGLLTFSQYIFFSWKANFIGMS